MGTLIVSILATLEDLEPRSRGSRHRRPRTSARVARPRYARRKKLVFDGPFTETKECLLGMGLQ
jgi:hypothetical protein